MTITLLDIRNAVINYLDASVTTTISTIAPDVPNALSPNEEFTYSITATNAAAPSGIQLTNVRYHLSISPSTVAKLKVPSNVTARADNNSGSPTLVAGTLVSEMFLFPADNILEVGDTDTVSGLKGKALALGNATISFDIHADVDQDYLFPMTTSDPNATRAVSVV
jgi:hypothetical protein